MADTAKCYPLIRGSSLRVTKLDSCGNVVLGPGSQVVTKGYITVQLTPEYDAGTTVSIPNAAGQTCIRDVPAQVFLDYQVQVEFCGVDPDLIVLMTGNADVLDDSTTPLSVGFRVNSKTDLSQVRFALEVWAGTGTQCGNGQVQFGYFLLPNVQGGTVDAFTVQNDAINFTVNNAVTKDGNTWGVGIYNVLINAALAASPLLTSLDPNDHLHHQLVNAAPPTVGFCGAQAVGVVATGAVAGIPGHYTPTNSYGPASLAGLTGVTASPNTAWTTGQSVSTRDGLKAHWSGTAWVIGAA